MLSVEYWRSVGIYADGGECCSCTVRGRCPRGFTCSMLGTEPLSLSLSAPPPSLPSLRLPLRPCAWHCCCVRVHSCTIQCSPEGPHAAPRSSETPYADEPPAKDAFYRLHHYAAQQHCSWSPSAAFRPPVGPSCDHQPYFLVRCHLEGEKKIRKGKEKGTRCGHLRLAITMQSGSRHVYNGQ